MPWPQVQARSTHEAKLRAQQRAQQQEAVQQWEHSQQLWGQVCACAGHGLRMVLPGHGLEGTLERAAMSPCLALLACDRANSWPRITLS